MSTPKLPLIRPQLLCTQAENKRSQNGIELNLKNGKKLKVKDSLLINFTISVEEIQELINLLSAVGDRKYSIKNIVFRYASIEDDHVNVIIDLISQLRKRQSEDFEVLNLQNNKLSEFGNIELKKGLNSLSNENISFSRVLLDNNKDGSSLIFDSVPCHYLRPSENTDGQKKDDTTTVIVSKDETQIIREPCEILTREDPVIILGVGISGSAMAASFESLGFTNYIVLERDASPHERPQGYGITLQQGNQALQKLGVLDDILKNGVRSTSHWIYDHKGKVLSLWSPDRTEKRDEQGNVKSWNEKWFNFHIPRSKLREVILERAGGPSRVTWGVNVLDISGHGNSIYLSYALKNDPSETIQMIKGSCIIDCSGIRSTLRPMALRNTPDPYPLRYLGILVILGIVEKIPSPEHTIIQCSDGEARIFSMPFDETKIMWQLSKKVSFEEAIERSKDKESLHKTAKEWTANFNHPIREKVIETDMTLITGTPVYDRQAHCMNTIPYDEQFKDKIIMIGDSAHPMSPFKGQGANQAIIDAYNLAQLLLSDGCSISKVIPTMNMDMDKRVSTKVTQSNRAIDVLHGEVFLSAQHHDQRKGISKCRKRELQQKLKPMFSDCKFEQDST